MKSWCCWWFFLLLMWGCGETPQDNGSDGSLDMVSSACANGLSCPLGSTLRVDISACIEVVKETTTALCLGDETCNLTCVLEQPCLCGVESRTVQEVSCAVCDTACGNGLCEPGEDALGCGQDCGAVCLPGATRCRGASVETCGVEGVWGAVTCGSGEVCRVVDGEPACEVCDPSSTWFVDRDGDGFGDPDGANVLGCLPLERFVLDNTDCDDSNFNANPASGCTPCAGRFDCAESQLCTQGFCTCESGFQNCDGDVVNGCETQVQVDDAQCGACGRVCEGDLRCVDFDCQDVFQGLISADSHSLDTQFTCALRKGQVFCWGANGEGQLGDGTQDTNAIPVAVAGLDNARSVSVGRERACAVLDTGKVVCWGPALQEIEGITDAVAMDSGVDKHCALLSSGEVWCWSTGGSPVRWNNVDNAVAVTLSFQRTCALLDTGRVTCGGSGEVSGLEDARAVAAGWNHVCAVLVSGEVMCWGANGSGQLGDGTSAERETPERVVGITNAVAVAGGRYHSCAVLSTGRVKCWGLNTTGGLGDGTITRAHAPVDVLGVEDAVAITAGDAHTCVLVKTGDVRCWGDNDAGQLGDGNSLISFPDPVQDIGEVVSISTLAFHSCAVLSSGEARCWGDSGGVLGGALGDGTTTNSPVPVSVVNIDTAALVVAGAMFSCVVLETGAVRCWGFGRFGQLGNGSGQSSYVPVQAQGISNATFVDSGGTSVCARLSTGQVKCWGSGNRGQLGDGATEDRFVPVTVSGITEASSVAVGAQTSCAVLDSGALMCWGSGFGPVPVAVAGLDKVTQVSLLAHTCAVIETGEVACWGDNSFGQLGNGTVVKSSEPVMVTGITNAVSVSVGLEHSCAILGSGELWCWGNNAYGQLGDGSFIAKQTPVQVAGLLATTDVSAGYQQTCAISDGVAYCWGDGGSGRLGNGYQGYRTSSVKVVGLPRL